MPYVPFSANGCRELAFLVNVLIRCAMASRLGARGPMMAPGFFRRTLLLR